MRMLGAPTTGARGCGGGAHRLSVNMQHAAGVRRRGAEENVALALQPRVALRREPNHEVAARPRRPRPADLHVRRALRHTIQTRRHYMIMHT